MANIKNISKSFKNLKVLDNINININVGTTVSVLGPSGCGKTTLLNIITGLIRPDTGDISGIDKNSVSYMFQEPRLLPWKTVYENISIVLKDKFDDDLIRTKTLDIIEEVGLLDYKDYFPGKISGGMQQRVALARAFVYPSDMLLMDEPFKSLDPELKLLMIKLFLKLNNQKKRTTLFVTHDIKSAILLGDEIYILSEKPAIIKEKIILNKKFTYDQIATKEFIEIENNIYKYLVR